VDDENCRSAVSLIDRATESIEDVTDWVLQDFRDFRGVKEGNLSSGACGQNASFIPKSASALLL
jgi:hypothetical protein